MPYDLSQTCRVIFDTVIADLEAFLQSGPTPVPGTTVIAGGVNSLLISSLAVPDALDATGGANSITITLAGSTPVDTVVSGGTNSVTITSLAAPAPLNATGGVNSISITGA